MQKRMKERIIEKKGKVRKEKEKSKRKEEEEKEKGKKGEQERKERRKKKEKSNHEGDFRSSHTTTLYFTTSLHMSLAFSV